MGGSRKQNENKEMEMIGFLEDALLWLRAAFPLLIIGAMTLGFIITLGVAIAAPAPKPPAQIGTCGVSVCSVQLADGIRCVLTTAGGLDCDWGEK